MSRLERLRGDLERWDGSGIHNAVVDYGDLRALLDVVEASRNAAKWGPVEWRALSVALAVLDEEAAS